MVTPKGWRHIVVEDRDYVWQVRDRATEVNPYGDTFHRKLTIRLVQYLVGSCSVVFSQTGYHWLGHNLHPVVITPRLVAHCVRLAIQKGWQPETSKDDFQLSNGDEIWTGFSQNEVSP